MKTREIAIWTTLLIVLVGGLWLLIVAVNNSSSPSIPVVIKIPEVSEDDFIRESESTKLGSSSTRLQLPEQSSGGQTKVTLIEYADFQCPACSATYPIIKKLEEDFENDLRVIYRFLPLTNIHQNSMISAQVAYAASLQNKFWEMHDLLYENQDSWGSAQTKAIFVGYAKQLGLDVNKFESDIDSETTRKLIADKADEAIALGISSVPTFFVNGKYAQNLTTYTEFKKIIQNEINNK